MTGGFAHEVDVIVGPRPCESCGSASTGSGGSLRPMPLSTFSGEGESGSLTTNGRAGLSDLLCMRPMGDSGGSSGTASSLVLGVAGARAEAWAKGTGDSGDGLGVDGLSAARDVVGDSVTARGELARRALLCGVSLRCTGGWFVRGKGKGVH